VYDGRPLDGVEVRIDADDDGRIGIRGPVVMSGYRLRPDLSEAALVDGWLATSDMGQIDADGRLRVIGRIDDIVITGGENVAVSHVADVLSGHPAVAEVVVTGVVDPDWGQRLVAVVVLARGKLELSLAELREWCSERLVAAARPRGLVIVDEIPRLASGKPDRLAVTRLAESASGDDGVQPVR
jgi:o-succinylbenzoate---CoA ligase